MTVFCRCCQKHLGPIRSGEWCDTCTRGIQEDMGRLQNLPPGELVLIGDMLATVGAFFLARTILHCLPEEAR